MINMNTSRLFRLVPALLLPCLLAQDVAGQIKRSVRVQTTPKKQAYPINDPNFRVENGYTGDGKWVVFASHDGAGTYSRPGGENKVRTLSFMDPCYVIGKKGDYLELAKYNSGLKFRRLFPKRVVNWDDVEYLGWVHRSQVLPWRVALKDADNKFYIKYITALSGREVLETPDNYFSRDSIKVFGRPDVTSGVRRLVPISTLLYAYQLSDDRKFYLVGTEPQCLPDSAGKSIIGWLPVQTVQAWGEKFYVETPLRRWRAVTEETAANQPLRLDAGTGAAKGQQFIELPVNDPVLNRFPRFTQTLYPVYGYADNNAANKQYRTSALSNVLDYRDNKVYNVLGQPLSYNRFQSLKEGFRKLNIVLVVDGTSYNTQFIAPVMTVLQQMQIKIDSLTTFDEIRYGAVFYREDQDCIPKDTLALTDSYGALSGFFENNISRIRSCRSDFGGSVFGGLTRAGDILRGHEDESNIIVVIGSDVNAGVNMYNWSNLVNGITDANARLLIYQTHSDASGAYNDFVIDSKKIITQTADNINELRKELMVESPTGSGAYDFRISSSEYSVFMLDYPANSRWQGAVVFPNKLESMPLLTLNRTLDTLLGQIHDDNNRTIASIERVFESYAGNVGTHIDRRFEPMFGTYTEALPERSLRHFRKNYDMFRFSARMPATDSMCRKGLLLSKQELDNLTYSMSRLALPFSNPELSRKQVGRQIRRYAKEYVNTTGADKPHGYGRMSTGDVIWLFTGATPDTPELNSIRLKQYGQYSDAEYNRIRTAVTSYYDYLKHYYNAPGVQQINALNNTTYYWIPAGL